MTTTPMMGCGHSANATDRDGNPVCVICYGIDPKATIVVDEPDLKGRKAKCSNCDKMVESNVNLPFFEYKPRKEYDMFYCGCRGWD